MHEVFLGVVAGSLLTDNENELFWYEVDPENPDVMTVFQNGYEVGTITMEQINQLIDAFQVARQGEE